MDVTASQNQGCDERLRKRGKYTWLMSFRRPSRTYSSSSSLHLSGVLMSQGYSRGDAAGSGAAEKEAHRTSTEHTDQCGGDPICYLHHIIWQYGRLLCNGKREGAGLRKKQNKGWGWIGCWRAAQLTDPSGLWRNLEDLRDVPRWRPVVALASLTDRLISQVPGEY